MQARSVPFRFGMDPDQALKIKTVSMERYRAAAQPFVAHCLLHNYDLLVEFKNIRGITKSNFENLVAAVEMFIAVVGAVDIGIQMQSAGLAQAFAWSLAHWLDYFPVSVLQYPATVPKASYRVAQGPQRNVAGSHCHR